ncbi:hypothetical protein ZIOFF_041893 [Zingiber officinale]|uniref:RRM domain-containing protein n=1 Tax=Zingiber officinale TaxID=94328 RepID=A0A8J5G9B9_ZINOF|nr:hypothetical protein ZIOFF_041893 [Zingiber officinale]
MDVHDGSGDDRTFKVSFSSDGLSRLREKVMGKLKEFMGDYTDDTLVDYVLVLLRNGRHKDEAKKELDVFLGEETATFISWLWDHLSSNIHLYLQPEQSIPDEVTKSKHVPCESSERQNAHEHQTVKASTDSSTRNYHRRGWKSKTQESNGTFPLHSVVTNILHAEEKVSRPNIDRLLHSPIVKSKRKRNRDDEHTQVQRDTTSYSTIGASRRLLQFAVRDAVKTVQQSNSKAEPALKRVCSVVSAVSTDSVIEARSHRRPESRGLGTLSIALKAAAEAAEDATKVRLAGSVFDRLGHSKQMEEDVNQLSVPTALELEDSEIAATDKVPELLYLDRPYRNEYDDFDGNMSIVKKEISVPAECTLDNNEYGSGSVNQLGQGSFRGIPSCKKIKSVMMQPNIVPESEEISKKSRLLDQERTTGLAVMRSKKVVDSPANVTQKHSHYQVSRDDAKLENQVAVKKSTVGVGNQSAKFLKDNDVFPAQNIKEIDQDCNQKEFTLKQLSAPGILNSNLYLENHEILLYLFGISKNYSATKTKHQTDVHILLADLPRMEILELYLLAMQVHFAATKDTLSRHFNQFGDVLKVIIVTDATTGQPTGSAYVEFLKKESADLALSLNGTSFMSRILKASLHNYEVFMTFFDQPLVVRRSSHEAAPVLSWSWIARAPAFASRVGRMPYPRGTFPGSFRGHPPIKPGARSLQWKRETSILQPSEGAKPPLTSNVSSRTARNLTYTRTEPTPKSAGLSSTI